MVCGQGEKRIPLIGISRIPYSQLNSLFIQKTTKFLNETVPFVQPRHCFIKIILNS